MTLPDYLFPIPSRSVFDKTVARDWYDGLTSGIAQSSQHCVAYKFDILAWGPSQEKRIFALSLLGVRDFERIVDLLSDQEMPKWPIWFTAWPSWSPGKSALAGEVENLLSNAGPPEYAAATDSMFEIILAIKRLDGPSRELVPTRFDGTPSGDNFDFWKDFLNLPE